MIVRMCPLCDSEMKKPHYCDACHSFIWKPDMIDIHLNTATRGKGEIDCSYGEVHDETDHRADTANERREAEAYSRDMKRQQTELDRELHGSRRGKNAVDSAANDNAEVFGPDSRPARKHGSARLTWAVVLVILILFLSNIHSCI